MSKKQLYFSPHEGQRIIAISDIHGHLDLMWQLLEQVGLQADDYLIILGDFINKGPDNLKIIRTMQDLSQRPNTMILKGNHELFIHQCLHDPGVADRFHSYLAQEHFSTIVHDMLAECQRPIDSFNNGLELQAFIQSSYEQELDFIDKLPIIAETDHLLYVHGGYDPAVDLEIDEEKLLKFDDFNRLSPVQDKKVIVGHWPTSNLRVNRNTNTPFFNHEKNIISIDGGMGVKSSGELNALIVHYEDGLPIISYEQANSFKEKTVLKGHAFHKEEKLFINYPHFQVEILETRGKVSLCRHLHTGKEITIFNCLLDQRPEGTFVTTTYINHFIDVQAGDQVLVCLEFRDCVLIKHEDEFGWILREQLA